MIIQATYSEMAEGNVGDIFYYMHPTSKANNSIQGNIHAAFCRYKAKCHIEQLVCLDKRHEVSFIFKVVVLKQATIHKMGSPGRPKGSRNTKTNKKIVARNIEICKMVEEGHNLAAVGRLNNLTRERVRQIVEESKKTD